MRRLNLNSHEFDNQTLLLLSPSARVVVGGVRTCWWTFMSLPQYIDLDSFRCKQMDRTTAKTPHAGTGRRRRDGGSSSSNSGTSSSNSIVLAGGDDDDDDDFEKLRPPKRPRQRSAARPVAPAATCGSSESPPAAAVAAAAATAGDQPVRSFVSWLRTSSTAGQLAYVHHIPAREPRYGVLQNQGCMSNTKLRRKLEQSPLYSHQAAAIDAVFEGGNVCIATGTASGKSRAFMVPCMEVLKADKDSRCLFIYPMKALAQDQARATRELAHEVVYKRLRVDTYDGDTPEKERAGIRKSGRIVLTNPDMLHIGILPNHEFWSGFLSNLAFVVIDEAHIYKGVFGSHMALILRRLRRLCKHYGCCPQFILSSATIANPGPFCAALVGLPVSCFSIMQPYKQCQQPDVLSI
jgi:hypothetical protein